MREASDAQKARREQRAAALREFLVHRGGGMPLKDAAAVLGNERTYDVRRYRESERFVRFERHAEDGLIWAYPVEAPEGMAPEGMAPADAGGPALSRDMGDAAIILSCYAPLPFEEVIASGDGNVLIASRLVREGMLSLLHGELAWNARTVYALKGLLGGGEQ